jgi:hypothetical protein
MGDIERVVDKFHWYATPGMLAVYMEIEMLLIRNISTDLFQDHRIKDVRSESRQNRAKCYEEPFLRRPTSGIIHLHEWNCNVMCRVAFYFDTEARGCVLETVNNIGQSPDAAILGRHHCRRLGAELSSKFLKEYYQIGEEMGCKERMC